MANRQNLLMFENNFRQLLKMIGTEWAKHIDHKLSRSQFFVLEKLHSEGPKKVSDLADALYITAGAVTGCSDKLIQGGYAVRLRDEADRRVVYLEITPKGTEAVLEVAERRKEVVNKIFAGLTDEDILKMNEIIKHIIDNAENFEG